ncbi:FtsP/CotA-like multicopper oxidase with cupredoxin domain [Microbacterium sp. AK009]|uniref:multicopper oxidase family protein n=1 Tax=Microbacterium sp. AK009 TaxID=2723068 RepID=UPI0015CAC6CB|nr:multicopper oxidase domain-containing protein [Microbacterium sp. AK009]NYF17975.1 FtsP/CotA-like multicopper oxidase with cupredoxin domain [Microbacterium sp. AK009]
MVDTAPHPRRGLRRPRVVIAVLATLAVSAAGVGTAFATGIGNAPAVDTVGDVDFVRPLAVPALLEPTIDADGTKVFALHAQPGSTSFVEGLDTPTWGFNGSYLGPTIRAARGDRVRVDVTNALDVTTSVHWHGMRLSGEMDGGVHQPIDPGRTWSPQWTIDQEAATLWYHPHPHGATEEHVRRGLAGLFLIDDPVATGLALPSEYGVDDIPVIVQDVALDRESGELGQRDGGSSGHLGDELLVNGTLAPYLEVATDVVRLRLVNASTARVYAFGFDDGRTFSHIATDGGLLPAPRDTARLQLSPGERAEILVRMTPAETVVLRSESPDLGGVLPVFGGGNGGADRFDVLELRAADDLESRGTIPPALAPADPLDPASAVVTREWVLDGTEINGQAMSMERMDAVVERGTVEHWRVRNDMSFPHNFHVHGVHVEVKRFGGAKPPAALTGPKDTLYLPPGVEVEMVLRFDHADPTYPLMLHCHLLRHEDAGTMAQFLVVEPGSDTTVTTLPPSASGHRH